MFVAGPPRWLVSFGSCRSGCYASCSCFRSVGFDWFWFSALRMWILICKMSFIPQCRHCYSISGCFSALLCNIVSYSICPLECYLAHASCTIRVPIQYSAVLHYLPPIIIHSRVASYCLCWHRCFCHFYWSLVVDVLNFDRLLRSWITNHQVSISLGLSQSVLWSALCGYRLFQIYFHIMGMEYTDSFVSYLTNSEFAPILQGSTSREVLLNVLFVSLIATSKQRYYSRLLGLIIWYL